MAASKDYSRSVIAASDELKNVYCEPCMNGGKQVEAEGFCVDCCEYLCGQCYKNHTRSKAFRHHVLQDKDKMPVDTTKDVALDVCVHKCDIHPTKAIEYFCKSCDQLGCHACITVNHRQCDNVDHIPDIAKDLGKSEEFIEFIEELDNTQQAVKERKKKVSSNITETDEMKRKSKAELKRQHDEIKKFFDHQDAEMERRIDEIDKNNKKTLKTTKSTCDTIDDDITQIKTTIDAKKKNGQNYELFITFKKCKQKKETVDKEFGKMIEGSKIQQYALTPSYPIKEMIKNKTEICRLTTGKFVSETKIHADNDQEKRISIRGLAVVQNHYLAVLDNTYKSVKVIDTRNMKVSNEMHMNCEYFWGMTAVNNDQIAVLIASDLRYKIQFLSVSMSGSLCKGSQIAIDGFCNGLAYSRGSFYILECSDVRIIDMQGNTLSTISPGGDCVAVSPNKETIYLANNDENSVTSMSLDGKVKAIYKDNGLKSPRHITVDSEGLVYVDISGNIHQLTEDFKQIQVLLEDVYAHAMTYSNTDNRLYIALGDEIKVYQIE